MTAATWVEVVAGADDLRADERRARLATVILAGDAFVSSTENPSIGLPTGKPMASLTRLVAARLLAEGVDGPLRVLALLTRFRGVLRNDVDPREVVDTYRAAIDAAADGDDRVIEAWTRAAASGAIRRFRFVPEALAEAEHAVAVAAQATPTTGFYAVADARWSEASDPRTVTEVVHVYAMRARSSSYRFSGRVESWIASLYETERIARPLLPVRYNLYGLTLNAVAVMERRVWGAADLHPYEQHAADPDDPRPERAARWMRSAAVHQHAYNAAAAGDKEGAIALQQERIAYDVRTLAPEWTHLVEPEIDVAGLTAAIAPLSQETRRARWNGVGNSAHEIDGLEMVHGDDTDRASRSARALGWSALAEAIWAGWGTNGLRAIRLHRARIAVADDPLVVAEMLDIARTAPSPGLRVSAAFDAALSGGPLAPDVLALLDEMLEEAQERRDEARLRLARAWLRRPGSQLADDSSIDDALTAGALLREPEEPDRVPAEWQYLVRIGWVLGIWSAKREDHELGRAPLHRAVRAFGRLLQGATTRSYAKHVIDLWAPMLRIAMDNAERWADFVLADLIAELSRRQTVPQQFTEASTAEGLPEPYRQAAAGAVATAPKGEDPTPGDDGGGFGAQQDEPDEESGTRERAAVQARSQEERDEALKEVERYFGPLGRTADFDNALKHRPIDLVGDAVGTTFVLQVLPSTYRTLASGEPPRLYRRLTWRDESGPREHLDHVDLDPDLLVERSSHEHHDVVHADLFPEPFIRAFRNATMRTPLRLHIVPTGLYHLYWDSMLIEGRPLIRRAITSQHTSITAARFLAELPERPGRGSVGLFDRALTFTGAERRALEQEFPRLDQPENAADLDAAPIEHATVFAMALHGEDDQEGWLQIKHLPNRIDTLSAAQALRYRYPRTCVLASCFSTIRSSEGFDLSGFPVALFSKGATTVIGSVNAIDDRATSEILSIFYRRFRQTRDPVASLRDARLEWIGSDRRRHSSRHLWARLVAYGGAAY